MIQWWRTRKLVKALRFYGLFEGYSDSEIRAKILIQKIRNDWILGVNYIHRALNPMDFFLGLDLSIYQDEKDKKRMEQDTKRMVKNADLYSEKEAKFREHALDVLGQAMIFPDVAKFPVKDIYANQELFSRLYQAILENSLGKKKIVQS